MPPADMFWGDRYGKLTDPFGHSWGWRPTSRTSPPRRCRKAPRPPSRKCSRSTRRIGLRPVPWGG
jgi:hypothetical protein